MSRGMKFERCWWWMILLLLLLLLLCSIPRESRRLTLFWHIACIDDNADAKRILSTLHSEDWGNKYYYYYY